MAHRIEMQTPPVELGGTDVVFEVFVDDEKRGELHISRGDLRWKPRHGRWGRRRTWEQFADWMESRG